MEEDFYIAESDLTPSMRLVRFYFHKLSPYSPRLATQLFWHLFTKPRPRKFSAVDESFYRSAHSINGISNKYGLSYKIHKKGIGSRKVLILHGWEGRSSDFARIITNLEPDSCVYSVDFPGHGKSPKSRAHLPIFIDVIESVLSTLGPVDAVVGHSLGAASLAMAIGNGSFEVDKLIFLGLHPVPSQYFLQYKKVTKVSDRIFKRCVSMAEKKTDAKLLDYSCFNYLDKYKDYQLHFIHDSKDKIIHVSRVEELALKLDVAHVYQGDHGGHFRHYKHQEVIEKIRQIIFD